MQHSLRSPGGVPSGADFGGARRTEMVGSWNRCSHLRACSWWRNGQRRGREYHCFLTHTPFAITKEKALQLLAPYQEPGVQESTSSGAGGNGGNRCKRNYGTVSQQGSFFLEETKSLTY